MGKGDHKRDKRYLEAMEKMIAEKPFPLIFGLALIIGALIGFFHGYQSTIFFFCFGILMVIFGYASSLQKPQINVNGINKNIGILNGILWGKQEKESAIKLTKEQYWQITTQDKCRDLQDIRGISYCWYGSKRGYCTYERCPRRIK